MRSIISSQHSPPPNYLRLLKNPLLRSWFDRLTTNGDMQSLETAHPEPVEGGMVPFFNSLYLLGGHHDNPLLLKEWPLVLRGDGKSPRTIQGYADSVRQPAAFLERGGFPPLTEATAEHVREGYVHLIASMKRALTVNS